MPVWSHNGGRIGLVGNLAYSIANSGDLWVLDINTSLQVTGATIVRGDQTVSELMPAWSPNDGRLVFLREQQANSRQYRFQIIILDLGTNAETVIVDQTKQAVFYPDWNPVGS